MIESIIAAALEGAPKEFKTGLKKIDEFMPMIKSFHDAIPLDKEKGELGVGYLLRFEDKGIVLYQVALGSLPAMNNGKPFVSRQLAKWNVTEKISEITKGL